MRENKEAQHISFLGGGGSDEQGAKIKQKYLAKMSIKIESKIIYCLIQRSVLSYMFYFHYLHNKSHAPILLKPTKENIHHRYRRKGKASTPFIVQENNIIHLAVCPPPLPSASSGRLF